MIKVLIVDDSVPIRNMLRSELESQGYEVAEASNGREAVDLARQFLPDVVLMDVLMPVMDGLEACRALREIPAVRSTFIIMLTATREVDDRVAGFDAGADDYMPKPFDPRELFARIRRGQRIMEERRSAMFDPLTDLFNRRSFELYFQREALRASRSGQPMSLIMCDLDHFKSINDRFGHGVGDEVLKATADILRRNLRRSDMPCRWGGEEFALLLPGTSPEDAAERAEDIRGAIAEHEFETAGKITASFGIAELTPEDNLLTLQQRADQALYRAKESGRNTVVSH